MVPLTDDRVTPDGKFVPCCGRRTCKDPIFAFGMHSGECASSEGEAGGAPVRLSESVAGLWRSAPRISSPPPPFPCAGKALKEVARGKTPGTWHGCCARCELLLLEHNLACMWTTRTHPRPLACWRPVATNLQETGFALETQALVAGALEQLELLIKMGAIAHTA